MAGSSSRSMIAIFPVSAWCVSDGLNAIEGVVLWFEILKQMSHDNEHMSIDTKLGPDDV